MLVKLMLFIVRLCLSLVSEKHVRFILSILDTFSAKMASTDSITLKRKVGGSIIEWRPVFTPDEKYLCVIEKECVRAYSTNSGECALEFFPPDEINSDIVGIVIHSNYLYGITSKGNLIQWSLESSLKLKVAKLKLPFTTFKCVYDLVLVDHGYKDNEKSVVEMAVLMSSFNHDVVNDKICVCLFDVNTMKKTCQNIVTANNNIHSVTFGGNYNKMFIGTIYQNVVYIHPLKSAKHVNRLTSPVKDLWTVIRAHPVEDCVAVGNNRGRVMIYYNVMVKNSHRPLTRTVYAWHTLPVADVIFSPSGTQMYSGGSECVLVKWKVDVPNVHNVLPRLPAPIVHFSISPMNTHLAISLQNNSIVLVNHQMNISCFIQKFTWGLIPVPGQPLFPAGICFDPNSHSLILNGRPGHIQFFSLKTNSLLYNLDITETNYISQEPNIEIINLEVTRFAFSQDGKWLTTIETRNDHETTPEIYMKIWVFNESNKSFKLNTYCDWPHQDFINAVKFQPVHSLNNEVRSEYCMVTTGNDKKFRIWLSVLSQVDNKKHTVWRCERIGFYKDYSAGPAGFSSDGSVLAVGFGPCLTIWDADNHDLVASLTRDSETLSFVEIEQKHYSHLAVAASSSQLSVWNLLTLTVLWTVPLRVSVLVADPLSEFMAAFTHDNILYVFKPSDPQPVYQKADICHEGKALAAIFVPQESSVKVTAGLPNWMHNSQLYFVTSAQELMCVETDDDNSHKYGLKQFSFNDDNSIKTPFAALRAQQIKTIEENRSSMFKNNRPVGLAAESAIRKLLSAPNHTMAPLNLLCNNFLRSFISNTGDKIPVKTPSPSSLRQVKKKKKNQLKEMYKQKQNEEFQQLFSQLDADIESMDVDVSNDTNDNDNATNNGFLDSQFDLDKSNHDMDIEVEDEKDTVQNVPIDVPINKMFYSMKKSRGNNKQTDKNKKVKLKKRERRLSKSSFVIDDIADFSLLNLFKINEKQ